MRGWPSYFDFALSPRKLLIAGAACLLILIQAAVSSQQAFAAVIFSDLGAGNSYDGGSGWNVSGLNNGLTIYYQAMADGFTSPGDYDVAQIDVALSNISGTNEADVSLWTDAGGSPGTELGDWTVSNQPGFGTTSTELATISGITGVALTAGSSYYLVVAPIADDTFDVFNLNSTGASGPVLINNGSGFFEASTTLSGFDVLSATVPEASTWAMMLIGFAGLGLAGYRRTRRAASIAA
jgi:PEP-CTERM motif